MRGLVLCREACFVCEKCGHEEMVASQLGHLEEPLICGNQMCREKWTMKMVHNRSTFHNKQIVKMQVLPISPLSGLSPQPEVNSGYLQVLVQQADCVLRSSLKARFLSLSL